MSKTGQKILIIVLALLLVLGIVTYTGYNRMVSASEKVENASANIETQLQRRADLIPNLVNTVKGYMAHEESVIASITESREKLMSASTLEERMQANDALTGALQSFNLVVENYPDLKSNTNFIQLQDELAGTENRIATARRDYNETVRAYNEIIRKLPGKLLASMFGFREAPYFEAKPGSDEVPNVSF